MVKKNSPASKSAINKHSFGRLKLMISLLVVVLIALGGLLLYRHHESTDKSQSTNKITNHSLSRLPTNSINGGTSKTNSSTTSGSNDANTGISTSSNNNGSFTVQITNSTLSNNNVHVGTLISGITSGDCTLTASQAGQSTITLGTSLVAQDVNNYDCGVFNIPSSTFPDSGIWDLLLTVTNSGESSSGSATITI